MKNAILAIVGILVVGGVMTAIVLSQGNKTEETVAQENSDNQGIAVGEPNGFNADQNMDGTGGENDVDEHHDMEHSSDGASSTGTVDEDGVRTFEIAGINFGYDITEMRVKKGETVKVVFKSESGFHDWVVDEFDAATEQIPAGEVSEITFVADETGEFEYYCSVGSHRQMGMVGTLIVEE